MHKKPLSGVTVIEFEGIGPCPLAGMMFADMGADVIVVGTGAAGIYDACSDVPMHIHFSVASAV